jgi:hypothetical protein
MMESSSPKLVFAHPFDERAAYEAEARGFLSYAAVQLPSGAVVPVVFWDAVRLQQDLEEEIASGRPFVAEPGMVVLKSVTLPNMEQAIQKLFEQGFFDAFKPQSPTTANLAAIPV